MTSLHATLHLPLPQAGSALYQAALNEGWTFLPATSNAYQICLSKSASAFSWGSTLAIRMHEPAPGVTTVTASTSETFALTDWGRGKRAMRRLFEAAGATVADA